MKVSFNSASRQLRSICHLFDTVSIQSKNVLLAHLSKLPLSANSVLVDYMDTLLFLCAYPFNTAQLNLSKKELKRISKFMSLPKNRYGDQLENTGLPFVCARHQFSHDFILWLNQNKACRLKISEFTEPKSSLSDVFKFTLPSAEIEHTTSGCNNDEILESLGVKKKNRLSFILSQFSVLDSQPLLKDYIFENIGMSVNVLPIQPEFSRAFNQINISNLFFHDGIIKQFDHIELLNRALPEVSDLNPSERMSCIDAVKKSMALMARETDPITYLDEASFTLYPLERGLSVAIYGMTPDRQLPGESYVGFTLFKNGYPASYGGGWVFGKRSLFGINIFDAFRGGESGYIMCQILRVYRQAFSIDYFEVEPYQYGADNPEGIASGAFWFYYRYGFRPLDKELLRLSSEEYQKIKAKKGYRSTERTLLRFTEGNIALNLGSKIPVSVSDLAMKVTTMIADKFNGDRQHAVDVCCSQFIKKSRLEELLNPAEKKVLIEWALYTEVLGIKDSKKLHLIVQLVKSKPLNVSMYQKLLCQLLD